ncbi:MAG TPA: RDD family protein [Marmoricola sp.]|nr:RDD family protein [Marmoricola sp.]
MTQIPAGWYSDPAQTHPGRLRYWDGSGWTEHVHDPQPPVPPAVPSYPGPQPAAYPSSYPYGAAPTAYASAPEPPTTPDGQPLSGWWRRVAAQVLDGLILSPVYLGILVAFLASRWDEIRTWWDSYTQALDAGTTPPSPPDLFQPWSAEMLGLVLAYTAVLAVYTLAFWRWKQATPGKLAVGIRIRRRETPGPMPWSTMLPRFLFVQALALAAYLPWVGLLFALTGFVDYLWPLWDRRHQALHDKVARTNVVRAPRAADEPTTTELSAAGLPRRW